MIRFNLVRNKFRIVPSNRPAKTCFIFSIVFSLIQLSCKDNSVQPKVEASTIEDVFTLANQNSNLKSLIVYKDDHIIKEKYFHSGDSLSAMDVRSATKSFVSTLIGIAIDKGFILSEENTIGEYLLQFAGIIDSEKAKIKIRDLLSMSSGLEGNDLTDAAAYANWWNSPNQINYTLNKPLINYPGKIFSYNNGAEHLLSAVLTSASGMSTFEFAKKYLFRPLEIPDPEWQSDKQNIFNGAAGLYLTPEDMLKLGKLYLYKGVYNGNRIISDDWIIKATSAKIASNVNVKFSPEYGYLWWLGQIKSHKYYFAYGYGGQYIVVVPDLNLIITASNNWVNVSRDIIEQQANFTLDLIINKIITLYE